VLNFITLCLFIPYNKNQAFPYLWLTVYSHFCQPCYLSRLCYSLQCCVRLSVVCRLSVTLYIVAKRCVLEQKLLLTAYIGSRMTVYEKSIGTAEVA